MFVNIIEYAHQTFQSIIRPEDVVVDATAGNGHDTVFLAKLSRYVYAFDVQACALDTTKKRLNDEGLANRVTLVHDSHANADHYLHNQVKVFVFNLGYLPGEDKRITTNKKSTLIAIEKALDYLMLDGMISITVYPGHDEGKEEAQAIEILTSGLSPHHYTVLKYQFTNRTNAPYNVMIHKHT